MDVGRQLSEARQRQNLTLADISRTTKIPVHLLEAIERNDVDHLPQGFFTRAFVRTYAKEVGADADSLVDSIEESEVEQVPMDLPGNVNIDEHASSRSFVAVVALCAALTVYSSFGWKTGASTTPQVAVVSAAQPAHATAVNAIATPPCVAPPPAAITVQPTRRTPPSPSTENVVTLDTAAAAPAVTDAIADAATRVSAPAAESVAVTSEPVAAPADQTPDTVPAEQF